MDDITFPGREEDQLFRRVLGQYDVPAFMRRAQRVQAALERVHDRCRRQREQWLEPVRVCLGLLHAQAGAWSQLGPLLAGAADVATLQQLQQDLQPQLRGSVAVNLNPRVLRRSLQELSAALARFNRRWREFVEGVDLAEVNQQRENYNRYYLLEKECALRSPRLARQHYRRLEPLTPQELLVSFPLLAAPLLALPLLAAPRLKGE